MNRTELIDAMAKETGLTKKDLDSAVKSFISVVTKEVTNGNPVQLIGFGTFDVGERKARDGRNPKTGATIKIAACKQPKFKAGKALKDAVNKKK